MLRTQPDAAEQRKPARPQQHPATVVACMECRAIYHRSMLVCCAHQYRFLLHCLTALVIGWICRAFLVTLPNSQSTIRSWSGSKVDSESCKSRFVIVKGRTNKNNNEIKQHLYGKSALLIEFNMQLPKYDIFHFKYKMVSLTIVFIGMVTQGGQDFTTLAFF